MNFIDYTKRKNEALRDQKIKSLIDFDEEYCSSIRSLAVKRSVKAKKTTRYLNGKMLRFSKISLKSLVYDLTDIFMFPNNVTKKIYDQNKVQKCFLYQNLTDTDSTSVFFVFLCELDCAVDERKSRQIILEVMIKSKIFHQLDLSDDFWDQFGVQNKMLKRQVGLFGIENINKANIIMIALNSKEYYEIFEDHSDNKKHKGMKKSTAGMDFDSYLGRLSDRNEFSKEYIKKPKKVQQKIFGKLNDKRFSFSNGIISLPYGHLSAENIRKEIVEKRPF